ncbi:MAG: gamma-glutamyltransferase, partial [bacterium]|nr:gamma-glutamyltransferase [bacterium]
MNHGIVTAGHEETAKAAAEILKAGGNAFDAIVAGGFAACVAESVLASLGGGGFLMAHSEDKGLERVYDFFVQTPKQVPNPKDLDFFPIEADFGPTTQEFHIGLGSVATPGIIAGFFEIHRDLGTLPITEVLAPAIRLCREGVPINEFQQYLFTVVSPIYVSTPESRKIFGSQKKSGKLVQAGENLKLLHLADTLEVMGEEGSDLFYRGEIAQRIAEQCKEGGTLKMKDLEDYRVHRHDPLEFFYRGHRLLSNPPPSCGGILIAFTLQLLDVPETEGLKFGSAEDLYQLAHAMGLTNKARLDALAEHSDWLDACKTLLDPGFLEDYRREIPDRPASLRGTTHLNVIDGKGNMASMSLSNGEGCG